MDRDEKVIEQLNSRKVFVEYEGLRFEVKVIGHRRVYGRYQYLVKPIQGSGEKWKRIEHVFVSPPIEAHI